MNKLVEEDDTLMTVYPKIRGEPEQRMKERYLKALGKIVKENKDVDDARKKFEKLSKDNENAVYTKEAERLVKKDAHEKEKARKDLLLRNLEV